MAPLQLDMALFIFLLFDFSHHLTISTVPVAIFFKSLALRSHRYSARRVKRRQSAWITLTNKRARHVWNFSSSALTIFLSCFICVEYFFLFFFSVDSSAASFFDCIWSVASLSLTLVLMQIHLCVAFAMTGCLDFLSFFAVFLVDACRWLVVCILVPVPTAAAAAAVLLAGRWERKERLAMVVGRGGEGGL